MISGEASAKITPSMPSKPQPSPLAIAICQCVGVTRVWSLAARKFACCAIAVLKRADDDAGWRRKTGGAHGLAFPLGRRSAVPRGGGNRSALCCRPMLGQFPPGWKRSPRKKQTPPPLEGGGLGEGTVRYGPLPQPPPSRGGGAFFARRPHSFIQGSSAYAARSRMIV